MAWSLLLTGCSTPSLEVARHDDDAGTVLKAGAGQRTAKSDFTLMGGKASAGLKTVADQISVSDHASQKLLTIGQTVRNDMVGGGSTTYVVQLPAGHVIQGEFTGHHVTLDLLDAEGEHLRRFGHGGGSPENFMWMTDGSYQALVLRSADKQTGQYALELTRSLAPLTESDTASPTSTDPTSPHLRALQQTLASGGNTKTFWKEVASFGTPLIEPVAENESLVTFLWRGAHNSVRLFGSPSGNHDALQRLGDSDVWWVSYRMPNTARLSYRLAPDVPAIQGSAMDQRRVILATAQRDPLNPNVFPPGDDTRVDVFQGDSALSLPDAPTQAWIAPRGDVKPGVLQSHRFISTLLGNERKVWTYIPNGATPKALLVLFDAQAYLERVPTPIIIDNLIADGLIPTTAVVLIDNPSRNARSKELPPNPEFAGFLDKELMPWVQAQGLLFPANRTVIAGSSYGGLASAYAGLTNPQWFGNVLSLSGSYWWSPKNSMPGWMMRQYAQTPRKNVRFYLDAGRYESGRTGQYGILETSRHFGDVLRAKGYTVTQVEHDTGHDYLHWQGSLGCGLVALLAPRKFNGLKQCAGQAPSAG